MFKFKKKKTSTINSLKSIELYVANIVVSFNPLVRVYYY